MRVHVHLALCLALLTFAPACNDHERLNRLEKENAELKLEVSKQSEAVNLELQQKCSNAAKTWFRENHSADKGTIMIDYSNHYNQKQRRCFILVEDHWSYVQSVWMNLISVWDVMENNPVAQFSETHHTEPPESSHIGLCKVAGTECHSLDEFNRLTGPLMSD